MSTPEMGCGESFAKEEPPAADQVWVSDLIDHQPSPTTILSGYESGMSPERWFARYAHTLAFTDGFDAVQDDPEADAWMQRISWLMQQSARYPNLDFFRRKHLTWTERRQVHAEMQ